MYKQLGVKVDYAQIKKFIKNPYFNVEPCKIQYHKLSERRRDASTQKELCSPETQNNWYDFNKMTLFNLIYTSGSDNDKANFVFNIVENHSTNCVHNYSIKLVSSVETIVHITTIMVAKVCQ